MVNRDLLALKLSELSGRLARVRSHAPPTLEALQNNRDSLDLVAFNLMLSVQSCADIASHLIADEQWPAAASLAESFERLEQHRVILEGKALSSSAWVVCTFTASISVA